ncbi:peptidoglycan/xylan/chitin deacetylase (PgdA/CDA1 family) [Caldicoprobacter guelmensis]|uniref:hypothetical protein n=1 Tax=Caldicoprobacter guelmensis TaxID=1170224 RepID=UPI00195EF552|nr:hypothetical protein [Caldicoprobacter guelmensis]MBM7581727.1 peptidoglycan/xylan/chitin deacetylase (PgdA/CDA1 family) [Caldicoprobacter guelmensis]
MKVIVTHDVDHIRVFEHKNDLIIPKFWIRSFIEFGLGYIAYREVKNRLKEFIHNKWHNLEELIKFDKENRVPSTFFVAVSKGRNLAYSLSDAEFWIKKIINEGFKVGVHGISFEDYDGIKSEHEIFKKVSGLEKFGIRMHYLKVTNKTLDMLNKVGYLYDSSIYELANPFKVGDLWEFPLSLMDGYIINKNSRYQNQNLEQVKDTTKEIIEKAITCNLKYFTILFHDRYFSESFLTWREWYVWLIEYLRENRVEFITFEEAIKELRET